MKKYRIYALGQDPYWLNAVTKTADEAIEVQLIKNVEDPQSLLHLLEPDSQSLLLLDPDNQPDMAAVVRWLGRQGWRYVIVVASDYSWKDAYTMLRGNNAYDYWRKSYAPKTIRQDIERCLIEIESGGG